MFQSVQGASSASNPDPDANGASANLAGKTFALHAFISLFSKLNHSPWALDTGAT